MEPAAGVAVVEAGGADPAVLLIRRAERADDPWSGHWALPGGRRQPDDPDLLATALRELAEEVGVRLDRAALVAELPPSPAGRHLGAPLLVAPFHLRVAARPSVTPDAREVAAVRWCPLARLRDPAAHGLCAPVPSRPDARFPCMDLDGHPLWGFTYRVLCAWLGCGAPR